MDILVAIFALCRRGSKIYIDELGFQVGRFVAVDTRRGAVDSEKWELRGGMIKARQFFPRLGGMASFASD